MAISEYNNARQALKRLAALFSEYNPRLRIALDEYTRTPAEATNSRATRAANFNRINQELNSRIADADRQYARFRALLTPEEVQRLSRDDAMTDFKRGLENNQAIVLSFNTATGATTNAVNKANQTRATQQTPATKPKTVIENNQVTTNNVAQEQKTTTNPSTNPVPPAKVEQPMNAPSSSGAARGLTGAKQTAITSATNQDQANFQAALDWRVRLVLAPGSDYFYNGDSKGILAPLAVSKGVIFPYTPNITVNYAATYEGTSLTHTNYKVYQYQNSSVDSVTLSCDFTAQDTYEANYLLAVIHFFRSMTKMFYGQDSNPKNGTPPPLCYIQGMGGYQFDNLPLAISGFNYALPTDVDYIPTTGHTIAGTAQPTNSNPALSITASNILARLGGKIKPGGTAPGPSFGTNTVVSQDATWVPTKIALTITCLPIVSRNQVSNQFSLEKYASGDLLRGSKNPNGGFW